MATPRPTLSLRAVGAASGRRVRRPTSWTDLLDVASAILNGTRATHIFDRQGDLIDSLDLVEPGETLYVGSSAVWKLPPASPLDTAVARPLRKRDRGAGGGGGGGGGGSTANGASAPLPSIAAAAVAAAALSSPSGTPPSPPSPLAALLPAELSATPMLITYEQPQRLCGQRGVPSRPPWGLAGDHTQLGSDANFTQLRGEARKEAFLALCERFARRLQTRSMASLSKEGRLQVMRR